VRESRIHYGLKEGVVDASGGYDSEAEEHEPRIVPRYFSEYRQYAEAATAEGGDGDDDEGVTTELEESEAGDDSTGDGAASADEAPTSLEVLAAARGLDVDAIGDGAPEGSDPGHGASHKPNGKPRKNGKVHRA
jgi:hypothetical protein